VRRRWPVEGALEGLDRDREIAVLLHVQIDELRRLRAVGAGEALPAGRAEQALQAVAERRDRLLSGQRGDLREDRRDLDGHHLDVGVLQRGEIAFEASLGLRLPEQRLAKEVHVHAHAFVPAGAQVAGQQLRLGRQHHIGGLVLHLLLHQRHRHARQVAAEGLKAAQQRTIEGREEARYALHVEDVRQLVGRTPRGVRAEGLIGHLHQGRLVGGVLEHAIELGLLAALLRGLERDRALLEPARQPDGS
jgi:hypothetical protein